MFLKIADIIHLILYQHQQTLKTKIWSTFIGLTCNLQSRSFQSLHSSFEDSCTWGKVFETMYPWSSSSFHQQVSSKWQNFILAWLAIIRLCLSGAALFDASFVRRNQNPPNISQCRLIEKIWVLIEQTVYQGEWEAKNLN